MGSIVLQLQLNHQNSSRFYNEYQVICALDIHCSCDVSNYNYNYNNYSCSWNYNNYSCSWNYNNYNCWIYNWNYFYNHFGCLCSFKIGLLINSFKNGIFVVFFQIHVILISLNPYSDFS